MQPGHAHHWQETRMGQGREEAHWALVVASSVVTMPTAEALSPAQNCCPHQLQPQRCDQASDRAPVFAWKLYPTGVPAGMPATMPARPGPVHMGMQVCMWVLGGGLTCGQRRRP